MRPLVVLSLFDGISAAQFALQRAGIPVRRYYASEVDPWAIKITQRHFPDTIQLGDVRGVWAEQFDEPVDLVCGGPPCQDVSLASKKRAGLDGDRSVLFFEYARLVKTLRPRWWLMENTRLMSRDDRERISMTLGTEPVLMNGGLVSAQARKRLWWANFSWEMPAHTGVMLEHILEDGYTEREKALTIRVKTHHVGRIDHYLKGSYEQIVWRDPEAYQVAVAAVNGWDICKRVWHPKAKAPHICTGTSGNTIPKLLREPILAGYAEDVSGWDCNKKVWHPKGKVPVVMTGARVDRKPKIAYKEGLWRHMTITECERAFTMPDSYTVVDGISKTARHRCVGNSWIVDGAAVIFRGMVSAGSAKPQAQLRLVYSGGDGRNKTRSGKAPETGACTGKKRRGVRNPRH